MENSKIQNVFPCTVQFKNSFAHYGKIKTNIKQILISKTNFGDNFFYK